MNVQQLAQKYSTGNSPASTPQDGGAMPVASLVQKYKNYNPAPAQSTPSPYTLGDFFNGKPTFPADTKTNSVLPNVARTFGNIPSDVAGIVTSAVKPLAEIPGAVADVFKTAPSAGEAVKDIGSGFLDTLHNIGTTVYGDSATFLSKLKSDPTGTLSDVMQKTAAEAINHPVSAALGLEGGGAAAGKEAIPAIADLGARGAKETVQSVVEQTPVVKAGVSKVAEGVSKVAEGVGAGKAANTFSDVIAPIKAARLPAKIAGLDAKITDMFSSAMRKSIGAGKKTIGAVERGAQSIASGVRTIVENKGALKLTDENGNVVDHALPRNTAEFGQAVQQIKNNLYKAYDAMGQAAGDVGAKFDATPIINKMKSYLEDTSGKTDSQIKAMESRLAEVQRLHGKPFAKAQEYITTLNGPLSSLFKTGAEKETSDVLATIASELRNGIDSQIARTEGPGYALIKKQFGSVKALEETVAKSINKRVPEGLGNLVNVFSGEDMLLGVITLNPYEILRGASLAATKGLFKFLNSPDRAVKNMFDYVDGVYNDAAQAGQDLRPKPTGKPQLQLPAPNPNAPKSQSFIPQLFPKRSQSSIDAAERANPAIKPATPRPNTYSGSTAARDAARAAKKKSGKLPQSSEPYISPDNLPTIK